MAYYPVNGGARFKYSSLVMLLVPATRRQFPVNAAKKLGEDLKKNGLFRGGVIIKKQENLGLFPK